MAAVDYFLKIDGIDGESHDAAYRGSIQLDSWSWSAENTGTMQQGGGGGGGRARLDNFNFTMKVSKASPNLMKRLASGEHIPHAVLTCRKAGKTPQEYLKVTFEDVIVASYRVNSAQGGGVVPTENIGFNFAKVTFEYREQKADGTLGGVVAASHDMKQNRTT